MDQVTESKVIGVATPRIDGPLKVSGSAMYASDHNFPGLLYAWPVCATISSGTVTRLDTAGAEKMPGVIAVYHRENIGKLIAFPPQPASLSLLTKSVRPLKTTRFVTTANMLLSSSHKPSNRLAPPRG